MIFWTLICLAQTPDIQVKETFHFETKEYKFVTRDARDFQRWETLKKINRLSSEILAETSRGGHPVDKIKLLKKLTKELEP